MVVPLEVIGAESTPPESAAATSVRYQRQGQGTATESRGRRIFQGQRFMITSGSFRRGE
jgi:hypothetical protein